MVFGRSIVYYCCWKTTSADMVCFQGVWWASPWNFKSSKHAIIRILLFFSWYSSRILPKVDPGSIFRRGKPMNQFPSNVTKVLLKRSGQVVLRIGSCSHDLSFHQSCSINLPWQWAVEVTDLIQGDPPHKVLASDFGFTSPIINLPPSLLRIHKTAVQPSWVHPLAIGEAVDMYAAEPRKSSRKLRMVVFAAKNSTAKRFEFFLSFSFSAVRCLSFILFIMQNFPARRLYIRKLVANWSNTWNGGGHTYSNVALSPYVSSGAM